MNSLKARLIPICDRWR